MPYTIEKIAQLIDATRIGSKDATINWLLTDSRSLSFPEDTLFFALQTTRNNGVKYIAELYARGVRNFVIEKTVKEKDSSNSISPSDFPDTNFLVVGNSLKALQKLAELHRANFEVPVIGITGSNGKTIVKEWLYQLLNPNYAIARSPRSYNSQIGVPLSVWQMNEDTQLGIFEAGISEPGEMKALETIIKPSIGVITSIGGAHQENFYSLQEKCMEKLQLFRHCDVIVYNGDNELLTNCVGKSMLSVREIAWSLTDKYKPLYIEEIIKDEQHTTIHYRYLEMDYTYTIPFVDDASIENSINCLGVCLYMMLSAEEIAERMSKLEPIAMRLEVKEGRNNCVLINDSYNSDLISLDIALDFLNRRSQSKNLKRTLILSDILETGQSESTLYRRVWQLIHNRSVDKLIGIGPEIASAFQRTDLQTPISLSEVHFFPNTESFLVSEVCKTFKQEIILIKGARRFEFERIVDFLALKVHETTLEINLSALIGNLNYFRSKLKPSTKTICMVKASAYGSGSYEVAKTLQEHHADYLAVAVADEGADLRKAGISSSIIVMNPEQTAFSTMFEYKLEPEIYNFHILESLIKAATREGITQLPIHIKIDTGMHRLGFNPEDMPLLVKRLKEQNAVIPRSIFSHLVGSDDETFDAFTREQIALFDRVSTEFRAGFNHRILRHISNSAGILRFPDAQFDMVRLGIGLYGINPTDNSVLQNVSTLKTIILQIRNVAAGETVGYSRKGKLERDSRIAAIPIGYADGLNRHLGNGNGYAIVNGMMAPYVGNICMDVCMIDVTDIDCKEGSEVIIFGDDLHVSVLSDKLDTIPYEVLTSVSNRVRRIYFQD